MRLTRLAPVLWFGGSLAWAGVSASSAAGGSASDAAALHEAAIVIDGHADTTPWLQDPEWDFMERHEDGHVDLPRAREGGLDGFFWSIWMPKTEGRGRALREAIERIDALHELVRAHPTELAIATTAAEVRRAVHEGRLACLIGIEGGHIIEESLPALRTLQRLGARYLTLTHSFHTSWADSSGTNQVLPPEHGGLTSFGEQVVAELNRIGMMVDVSHVSDETFFDVMRVTRAPVIASHSATRAVADHPRNLSDEMLEALAANGGVAMINFYSGYIDPSLIEPIRELFRAVAPRFAELGERYADDPVGRRRAYRVLVGGLEIPRTSLSVLLDHFDHAIRVAGADHVGLGADWDGVASMPEEIGDVSRLPALTAGLLERGHSPATVRKVLGGNVLRVMEAVERVASQAVEPAATSRVEPVAADSERASKSASSSPAQVTAMPSTIARNESAPR